MLNLATRTNAPSKPRPVAVPGSLPTESTAKATASVFASALPAFSTGKANRMILHTSGLPRCSSGRIMNLSANVAMNDASVFDDLATL